MSDIATLGIRINSTNLKDAKTALDQFSAAAKPAADATDNLGHSHTGLSTQAMAAMHSTRSLVEAMVTGMPVTMAMGQQISHLSYAASGPGGITGAFSQAAKALLGMLSPSTLVVGGLAAVAAGGALAMHSIAETEKQFDDASRAAGVTVGQLHDQASAAEFKGIDNSSFLSGIAKFSGDVYQAKNNFGQLAELLRANGQSATSFEDAFSKVANLIKNASSDQQRLQLLQQAGLPATMDWVRFMSQGADGIRQAAAEAAKFGETADTALIAKARKFDEEWARTWSNFKTGSKDAILNASDWLAGLNFKINAVLQGAGVNVGRNLLTDAMRGGPTPGSRLSAGSDVADFYKGLGTDAPGNAGKPSVDKNARLADIARQQPLLGLLGQAQPAKKPDKEKDDRDHMRLPKAA